MTTNEFNTEARKQELLEFISPNNSGRSPLICLVSEKGRPETLQYSFNAGMGMASFSAMAEPDRQIIQSMLDKGELVANMAVPYYGLRYKLLQHAPTQA